MKMLMNQDLVASGSSFSDRPGAVVARSSAAEVSKRGQYGGGLTINFRYANEEVSLCNATVIKCIECVCATMP